MLYHKIHAYIRGRKMAAVENELTRLGVSGFSFCVVRGMGEYADYFNPNHHVEHARLEIIVPDDKVDTVVEAVVEAAQTNSPGDGLVAVMPVERVVRIRNRSEVVADSHESD